MRSPAQTKDGDDRSPGRIDRTAAIMTDRPHVSHLARLVLVTFVLTFVAARVLVLLIMTHRVPDLFMHVGDTHVHHLNYGIFLLSGVGAFLLFVRRTSKSENASAIVYGIGLALTFDEFGMWLHLGGAYWQRASFDAVIVIAALLALFAFAPNLQKFRTVHWSTLAAIVILLSLFGMLSAHAWGVAGAKIKERIEKIEAGSPP
jgi:Ca2+/Na+ antiporter